MTSSQQIHAWHKIVRTVSVNMKIPVAVADLTFRKTFPEKGFCIITPLLHSLYAVSCLTKIFSFFLYSRYFQHDNLLFHAARVRVICWELVLELAPWLPLFSQ